MKIALINENSQAAKNGIIEAAPVAEKALPTATSFASPAVR